ncbi:MAG: gliding motility-associated C-terminal domain-containing protein [Bacteroidales bacterium]|nr:gliding motility-associated C-terminal domain-containing protein [Bacteroidales bacterium]
MRYSFILLLFVIFASSVYTQNVNFQVQVIALRCNIASDGIFGGPDPTWKVWAKDDVNPSWTGGNCVYRDDVSYNQFTLDTTDASGELPYTIRDIVNSTAQQVTINFEGFEKDCEWFGVPDRCTYDGCCDWPFCLLADDQPCFDSTLVTINFRDDPKCQWNYYGWFTCGLYDIKVRIRWDLSDPPIILTQPTSQGSDIVLCDPDPLTLTVVADNSVTFYQWQVSANTSLNPPTGWTDIPGATAPSYTVQVIPGTRNYRVKVTSACTPTFVNATVISQPIRVTHQPYPQTPINSPLCGSMVLPYSTHYFSSYLEPSLFGIVNPSGWLWTGSPGLIIHTPNASGTNITFPSYGLYQINVEYMDACSGLNTVSPDCMVIVGSSHCDYVYVSPAGVDDSTGGTPDEPVKTLAYAITMATDSRNTIRMLGGTYNETEVIHLKDDLTIDGGYIIINGNWIKSSAETTTININPPLETVYINNVTIGFYRGFSAQNVSNWTLQDLHIHVKPAGATGTTDRSGNSVYGIHIIDSCNNYHITRCDISAGAASAGENGLPGSTGVIGNNGGNGMPGGENSGGIINCDLDANGQGGTAGIAVGSGISQGGTGGNGGMGQYEEFDVYAQGENGFPGGPGGGGEPGGSSAGQGGIRSTHCTPGAGQNGQNGTNGQDGVSYLMPAVTNYDFSNHYWIPSYGINGGDGHGGGGGQGGGGSSGQGTGVFPFCLPGRGNGGGAGGGGGEGGTGGQGGGGGGSSFVIYASGWGNGIITSSVINPYTGPPTSGGTGNIGGTGGTGGAGGLGNTTCLSENGAGGNGGIGGNGGTGGKGQDGAQGINTAIALGNTSTINGSSTSIPNPTTITIGYNNNRGCTNSEIEITKLTGTWGLPSNAQFVYDINEITSSYDNTSDSALIFFTNTGNYDIDANGGTFDSFIRITDNRILPDIIIETSPACHDSIIYLHSSLLATQYEWLIYTSSPENAVFASPLNSPQIIGLDEGIYFIRLRQYEPCCGWSIPVFDTLQVFAEMSGGQISGANEVICYGTSPDSLLNIIYGSGGDTAGSYYQWQMSVTTDIPGTPGQWTIIPGTNSPDLMPGNLIDTTYFVRAYINNCGTVYSNVVTLIVYPPLEGGIIVDDTIICEENIPGLLTSLSPASGGYGISVTYQWQFSTSSTVPGTPGWNIIPASNNETYQPGTLNQTTYFVRQAIDSCGTAYSNIITIIVDSLPVADAGSSITICDTLSFNLNAQLPFGNGYWYQSFGPGQSVFLPNNQISNPTVIVSQEGNYTYTWVITNGSCKDSADLSVSIFPGFTISITPLSPEICQGDSIGLTASGAISYSWEPVVFVNPDSATNVMVFPDITTTYTITGISDEGCTADVEIVVTVHEFPDISLGEDIYFCSAPIIILDAGASYQNYLWTDGSSENTYTVSEPGIYWVAVDNHGCITRDTIDIMPCVDVDVPNVITPNNDGYNDYFYAKGNFKSLHLIIYNRWGKEIYETSDISGVWDGKVNGAPAAEGTYYYIITYKTVNYHDRDEELSLKGSFAVLR